MSTHSSSRISTQVRASSAVPKLSTALGDQLTVLYNLAQRSAYVFGSPLGPFTAGGRQHHLPRFVYFGPHTSAESPRLALLAGFDSRDLRPTLALLHLIEELALEPDLGQSLHLAFFPLIDVLGHQRQKRHRGLAAHGWRNPSAPEIELLTRDARLRNYHVYLRVESSPADDAVTLRLRTADGVATSLLPISSEDVAPFPVRWEVESGPAPETGPLALGEDLPFHPFELTLRVPQDWSLDNYRAAVSTILKSFIVRYRSFLAYGQHL